MVKYYTDKNQTCKNKNKSFIIYANSHRLCGFGEVRHPANSSARIVSLYPDIGRGVAGIRFIRTLRVITSYDCLIAPTTRYFGGYYFYNFYGGNKKCAENQIKKQHRWTYVSATI